MVSAALPSLNTCRRSDMEKQRGDRRLSLRRDILSSWRFLSAASVGCLTSYYLFLGQPGAPNHVLPLLTFFSSSLVGLQFVVGQRRKSASSSTADCIARRIGAFGQVAYIRLPRPALEVYPSRERFRMQPVPSADSQDPLAQKESKPQRRSSEESCWPRLREISKQSLKRRGETGLEFICMQVIGGVELFAATATFGRHRLATAPVPCRQPSRQNLYGDSTFSLSPIRECPWHRQAVGSNEPGDSGDGPVAPRS